MPRIEISNFDGGLWLSVPEDKIPDGGLAKAKGVDPLKTISIRSRNGQTAVTGVIVSHSLTRFNDNRYVGTATQLLRDGATVTVIDAVFDNIGAFDGTRLAFSNMQVGLTKKDNLFVAGGGAVFPAHALTPVPPQGSNAILLPAQLCKVDSTGVATRWGITNETQNTQPALTVALIAGASFTVPGTYQWRAVYRNSTTGTVSNPTVPFIKVLTAPQVPTDIRIEANQNLVDPQVDKVDYYRTVLDGSVFFFAGSIDINPLAPAFDDQVADADLGAEIQFDNTVPSATFEDCFGPHVGRMWWARINEDGLRGRVVYSPIGRPESQDGGFLDLASDDEQTQKIIGWNGALWVLSEKWLYQVVGFDEPFRFRQVMGTPGTIAPHTVVGTPSGLIWMAQDGLRGFDGAQSRLIGFDALGKLFRGEAAGGNPAFEGVTAAFVRGEYMISNGVETYALDLNTETWREVGKEFNALYWEPDTDELLVSDTASGKVMLHESEGVFTDDGAAIAFELETAHILVDGGQGGFVQRIYVDANFANQNMTPTLVLDGVDVAKSVITNNGRGKIEIPVGRQARKMGFRLTGSLTSRIELFGVYADIRESAVPA